jgi:membrane-associated phospholipid phosphatase
MRHLTMAATSQQLRRSKLSTERLLMVGAAALAFLLCLAALAIWTASRPAPFDTTIHHWVVAHRSTVLVHLATLVTGLGATIIALPLVVVGAVAATSGRPSDRLQFAVIAGAIMASGLIVRLVIADAVGRPRPPVTDWATGTSGYAFPSGHTTAATMAAALLTWLILRRDTNRGTTRALVCTTATIIAVTVGLTRIYLGVHWPTDVLGGWAFALAWVSFSIVAIRLRRDHVAQRPKHSQ